MATPVRNLQRALPPDELFFSQSHAAKKSLRGEIHRAVITPYNTRLAADLHAGNPALQKPKRLLNSPHSDKFHSRNIRCRRRGKTRKFKTSLNANKQDHLCACFCRFQCLSSGFCGNYVNPSHFLRQSPALFFFFFSPSAEAGRRATKRVS